MTQHHDGPVIFKRPQGAVLEAAPALSPPCVIASAARAKDLPVWDGARFDVAYAIDVLHQSMRSPRFRRDASRQDVSDRGYCFRRTHISDVADSEIRQANAHYTAEDKSGEDQLGLKRRCR